MKIFKDPIHRFEEDSSSQFSALRRRLHLHAWFPHVPLAIAVLALGILHVSCIPVHGIGWEILSRDMKVATDQLLNLDIHNLPQIVPAFFLIVMSIGILLRSFFAWIITLLFICASLVMDIYAFGNHGSVLSLICDATMLALLVYFRRYFQKRSIASTALFAAMSLVVLLGYAVIGAIRMGDQFSPPIKSFVTSLYFAIETMSTVGYGTIVPVTANAKIFVISVIILGITVFATVLSTIVLPIFNNRIRSLLKKGGRTMERFNHYVIVGDSALARNTYKTFRAKGDEVTVILSSSSDNTIYRGDDILIGDGSDLDVLKQASANKAIAILAIGDDDAENAFVILAAKELDGNPKTVAGVSDSRNLKRVHWVKPDLVIAPPVLGGEILAMTLSGEKIDSNAILDSLFYKLEK